MRTHPLHPRPIARREFIGGVAGAMWVAAGLPRVLAATTAPSVAQAPLYWAWWGWEPLDHYRRTGGIVGAVDTKSPTLPQWYERLHSEDVVRMMADLGVNLGCTHFFKGFGLVHEHAEQQRTARLVRFAHRHGVRILGYCQSRSIYHEQFLAEVPDAADWIQRDEQGRLRTWGGAKFRWAPCIHGEEFRAYLKRAIRVGLEEVGLDGFHFDNNYSQPCYCRRCDAAFGAWMARRRPDVRVVRQPPTEKTADRITDPLTQEWVRWRCESLADYQADLTAHARRIKPDVLLLGNPAYPRDSNSAYARSVWAPLLGRHLDLMFAENGNFPGLEDGALISQVRACKHAAAVGYRVVSTVWRKNKLTGLGLPEDEAAVALQIAESAANGAVPGTNWALRPLGEGDRMRVERPDLRAALAKYLRFARATESLRVNAKPVRDIAVLHTFASTAFDNRESVALSQGAEEVLIRGGFVWDVVFGEDLARLPEFNVLVVAGQSLLHDAEAEAIRAFVGRGGALMVVGDSPALASLRGQRVVRVGAEAVRAALPPGEGRVALPPDWWRLADAIARTGGDHCPLRLRGSDTVTLSAGEIEGPRLVAHLVNYAGEPTAPLSLSLGGRWKSCRRARLLTPDGPERALVVGTDAGTNVEIPPFRTYGVVVVE